MCAHASKAMETLARTNALSNGLLARFERLTTSPKVSTAHHVHHSTPARDSF